MAAETLKVAGGATHCKRGHEFTVENTYRHGAQRQCRECSIKRLWKKPVEDRA